MTLIFAPILAKQQLKSEQQFFSQHGQLLAELSEEQLNAFKQAITLSDFILNSAMQAPELVLAVFKAPQQDNIPDYKKLLINQLNNCTSEVILNKLL